MVFHRTTLRMTWYLRWKLETPMIMNNSPTLLGRRRILLWSYRFFRSKADKELEMKDKRLVLSTKKTDPDPDLHPKKPWTNLQ